ncbi:AAA family ATPase [Streptococcus australis]|uniref:AAA family ATPase n=1 Tax=Streptococcus TaxID=1301 RepID=UPI00189A0BA6|nr:MULTISPECIES: AAA family ATPase [Streptococcus]MBZ2154955.1 AAA family ATPase [Streptococcus australis]
MLKKVTIKNLFDKEDINIDFSKRSVIITGDNGNGKTTILNIIYNVLVGNYPTLIKMKFDKINIKFQSEFEFMNEINIELKKNDILKQLIIRYKIKNKNLKIEISSNLYNNIIVNSIKRSNKILYQEDRNDNLFYFLEDKSTIIELLAAINENEFKPNITEINKSLLYFPTYRRIDLDIESYFSNLYDTSMMKYFKRDGLRKFTSFGDIDRRVIGISNTDIEDILREYSRTLNEISSNNLDILLRDFAKNSILGMKEDALKFKSPELLMQTKILEQLTSINDSLNLEISNKQLVEISEQFEEKLKFFNKIKKNKPKDHEEMDKVLDLFMSLPMMQVFQKLQESYLSFNETMASELENYKYIQENLLDFSGNKLKLNKTELNEFYFFKEGAGIDKFNDFSTGEKQLITFLVYSAIELPKNTPSLIIIDEPELSLHVKWQNKLLKNLLKKSNIKILSATHSPYILNKLEVDSLIVRKQEANEC